MITSRSEAAKKGERQFFTGRPCKRGHITNRYTLSGCCVSCNAALSMSSAQSIKVLLNDAEAAKEAAESAQ